jgi:Lrp/AsnC family transcriptional regulator
MRKENFLETPMLDAMDIKILNILQEDSTLPVAEIGKKVGLSTTPCWRRIQKLEQDGVIEKRVALLNPKSVGAGVTVFVAITTNQHNSAWLERFHSVVESFPEIVEAYRMSGQVDYLLRVAVPDIASYDKFYKAFISKIDLTDVSSSFAMEQIKFTTALPLSFAANAAAKRPLQTAT